MAGSAALADSAQPSAVGGGRILLVDDEPEHPELRVVEVYVSRLRARLKATAIETLRNTGYQLHPA